MPGKPGPKPGPQNRETAISVAYLRLTGSLQTEAAEAVGIHHDTIGRWEKADWWPEIVAEASTRWLSGLEARARVVLKDGMDATIALKVLERRISELAPPTHRTDLTSDGGALAAQIHIYMPDNLRARGNGGRDEVLAAVRAGGAASGDNGGKPGTD